MGWTNPPPPPPHYLQAKKKPGPRCTIRSLLPTQWCYNKLWHYLVECFRRSNWLKVLNVTLQWAKEENGLLSTQKPNTPATDKRETALVINSAKKESCQIVADNVKLWRLIASSVMQECTKTFPSKFIHSPHHWCLIMILCIYFDIFTTTGNLRLVVSHGQESFCRVLRPSFPQYEHPSYQQQRNSKVFLSKPHSWKNNVQRCLSPQVITAAFADKTHFIAGPTHFGWQTTNLGFLECKPTWNDGIALG